MSIWFWFGNGRLAKPARHRFESSRATNEWLGLIMTWENICKSITQWEMCISIWIWSVPSSSEREVTYKYTLLSHFYSWTIKNELKHVELAINNILYPQSIAKNCSIKNIVLYLIVEFTIASGWIWISKVARVHFYDTVWLCWWFFLLIVDRGKFRIYRWDRWDVEQPKFARLCYGENNYVSLIFLYMIFILCWFQSLVTVWREH